MKKKFGFEMVKLVSDFMFFTIGQVWSDIDCVVERI
jgi:hypothetical protein